LKNFLLYFLIIIFYGAIFTSCENSDEAIKALNKKVNMVDEVVKVESYLSQGGKTRAKLTAPFMTRTMGDTTITEFPKNLHVDFYNEMNEVTSWLDCKYGKYLENVNKIYLKDSVRVISKKGDTLLCKNLWWDQNKELFYTDLEAIYQSPSMPYYKGENGMEATQDLNRITFKKSSGRIITDAAPQ